MVFYTRPQCHTYTSFLHGDCNSSPSVCESLQAHQCFCEHYASRLLVIANLLVQREFALHLLPLLTRKLRHTIPRLLHHPSLLAHTIYQTLAFDVSLKDQGFSLERTTAATTPVESEDIDRKRGTWEGVSEQILGKKEWFEAWLEGEHQCESAACLDGFEYLIPH